MIFRFVDYIFLRTISETREEMTRMGELVNIQNQDTREAEILNTFSLLLPQMTEIEKEKLLAFGEGMVLMSGILRGEKNSV